MPEDGASTLFDSTARKAGEVAARSAGRRTHQILTFLQEHGPSTLFEIAAGLEVFDHQISGRLTKMNADGLVRRTGERRRKPETGCEADVWAIAEAGGATDWQRGETAQQRLAERLGFPQTLKMEGELFDRGVVLEAGALSGGKVDLPGMPYARRADGGGARVNWRVVFVECDGCGRKLKLVEEGGPPSKKTYRCGTPACNRVWHLQLVQEPGGQAVLALVMKHL